MAGNAISGSGGTVLAGSTILAEVMKWKFTEKATIHPYSSNKTGGYKAKVTGTLDGDGTIEGAYDPANPITSQVSVGQAVALKLYHDASAFRLVPAVIETIDVDVNVDTGDIVKWAIKFQSNGAWTDAAAG